MLAWESLGERERLWNTFAADPEWLEALADSERDGIIVGKASNMILKPTAFSAIQ